MLTDTAVVAELRFELSGCIENACMHIHERTYRSVYMYTHAMRSCANCVHVHVLSRRHECGSALGHCTCPLPVTHDMLLQGAMKIIWAVGIVLISAGKGTGECP